MFDRQIAFNISGHRQTDGAALFGHNDRNRIGFLGDSDAGPMARPQLGRQHRVQRQWQKTRGSGNPVFLHNHGAVMERSTRAEYGRQQIVGEPRIQRYSAFNVGPQPYLSFNHDQCAGLIL
jgi:hypothetical protein